ncbi:hypothetical protein GCM10023231_01300 [Olivibacter ginsenosidimutans]|uniref:Thioredoxin domain-containing protein n=2 Tax=Olivibacter ginsenosidimutans TaxID=1176537 RepID=A0ABP9AD89_9SPHI
MILFCVCLAHARQQDAYRITGTVVSAATGVALSTDSIIPLKIGDTIPEALWNLPLQIVNHPEGKDTITLNDYRDRKLIIIDFWASYCHPCIRSIDKFDTIRRKYTSEQLMLLPVQVYDLKEKALPFIKKHGWQLPSIVGDTIMNKKYFRRYITGFGLVWIANGRLLAVPDLRKVNESHVERAIKRKRLDNINRKEQPIDNP